MTSWLGQGRLGFAYVSVKPEFRNHQFCLWAFGSGYKRKIVWLLRPVVYCGIYGGGETTLKKIHVTFVALIKNSDNSID
jgi:hypothetical protein